MDHNISDLSNPLKFAFMAVVGCTVGHVLMAPLGLFDLSAQIGAFFQENLFNLSPLFAEAASTTTAASIAQPLATPFCHLHGAELVCH